MGLWRMGASSKTKWCYHMISLAGVAHADRAGNYQEGGRADGVD